MEYNRQYTKRLGHLEGKVTLTDQGEVIARCGFDITKEGIIHTWDNCDFIRYEIGHYLPRNAGGQNDPENLCFMSGRCNQHIQASLPLDVVMNDLF